MARKSAPPKAPAKKRAKPRRRLNVRSWARNRIEKAQVELAMFDACYHVLQFHRRKLRAQIRREEKELLAPAPVAPDFPMKVAPARAKK